MLDEPTGVKYFGGDVGAPVFSTVMGQALRLIGFAPDAPATLNVEAPKAPGSDPDVVSHRARGGVVAHESGSDPS
jgi:cell division protein FtsI (penicillin-binding protein 3)